MYNKLIDTIKILVAQHYQMFILGNWSSLSTIHGVVEILGQVAQS